MPTFQTFLRTERKRLRLTQAQCAALLDMPVRTYAARERGERNAPKNALYREGVIAKLQTQPTPE